MFVFFYQKSTSYIEVSSVATPKGGEREREREPVFHFYSRASGEREGARHPREGRG